MISVLQYTNQYEIKPLLTSLKSFVIIIPTKSININIIGLISLLIDQLQYGGIKMSNLKGNEDELIYFRNIDTGKKELRTISGKVREVTVLDRVYFDETTIRNLTFPGKSFPIGLDIHYTKLNNYLLFVWYKFLGMESTYLYIQLLARTFGKEVTFVSKKTIEEITGRGQQAVSKYIDTLEKYSFLKSFYVINRSKKDRQEGSLFVVRRKVPLLPQSLYDTLNRDEQRQADRIASEIIRSQKENGYIMSDFEYEMDNDIVDVNCNSTSKVASSIEDNMASKEDSLIPNDVSIPYSDPNIKSMLPEGGLSLVFTQVSSALKSAIADLQYNTWIAPALQNVEICEKEVVIRVQTLFHKDILDNKYKDTLESVFKLYIDINKISVITI